MLISNASIEILAEILTNNASHEKLLVCLYNEITDLLIYYMQVVQKKELKDTEEILKIETLFYNNVYLHLYFFNIN